MSKKLRSLILFPVMVMALALAFLPAASADAPLTVTILHTNDTHAHLESFGSPLQGGVARRFTAIQQVRAEGGNVILVDAGDAFQGTLFFNQWQGEEEAFFMNALGYQAMAVGNHEFDSGPETLAAFIQRAGFPVLSANIDASADPALSGLIEPYTILSVGGQQVGVLGLTTEEVPSISSPGPNLVFSDAIAAAQATVALLEAQGINKIIALTHVGYSEDLVLAAAVTGIDVIVGGHSHTPLGPMPGAVGPYPTVVTSPSGDSVLVVSAFEWGKYLGRLDVDFSADGKVSAHNGAPMFVDESYAEDPDIAALVAQFAGPIEELRAKVIGASRTTLEGTRALVRSRETNLGDLICDAMLWKTTAEGTQVCVTNGGGIRASIPAGPVTMGQVLEVLPFGNAIATFELKGDDLWASLENGVSRVPAQDGRFPQVGGMRYIFDPTRPAGSRIISVQIRQPDGSYRFLDKTAKYKVVTNDFMRRGGDGYTLFFTNGENAYDAGAILADAVAEYIQVNSPVTALQHGRILQFSAYR